MFDVNKKYQTRDGMFRATFIGTYESNGQTMTVWAKPSSVDGGRPTVITRAADGRSIYAPGGAGDIIPAPELTSYFRNLYDAPTPLGGVCASRTQAERLATSAISDRLGVLEYEYEDRKLKDVVFHKTI